MTTPAFSGTGGLEVASQRFYVVYEARTGAIRHVHQSISFVGAPSRPVAEEEARALTLAGRFGHPAEGLRVLPVEAFDGRVPQKVDVKAGRLVPAPARPGARKPGQRPASPARPARGQAGRPVARSRRR